MFLLSVIKIGQKFFNQLIHYYLSGGKVLPPPPPPLDNYDKIDLCCHSKVLQISIGLMISDGSKISQSVEGRQHFLESVQ